MSVERRTILFPPDVLLHAEREADVRFDGDLSATVVAALQAYMSTNRLGDLLARWQDEHGPFSEQDISEAVETLWG